MKEIVEMEMIWGGPNVVLLDRILLGLALCDGINGSGLVVCFGGIELI